MELLKVKSCYSCVQLSPKGKAMISWLNTIKIFLTVMIYLASAWFVAGQTASGPRHYFFLSDQRVITVELISEQKSILNYINLGDSFEIILAPGLLILDAEGRAYHGHVFEVEDATHPNDRFKVTELVQPNGFVGYNIWGNYSFQTPPEKVFLKVGSRIAELDFAGWEMPVHYGSALKEHLAVRERVGVFDVSHMGEIEVLGPDALAMVQKVTSNDISRLSDGQAQYSAFLNPQGTFIDDIVVYRISDQHIFVCVNAANREKDYQWVQSQKEGSVDILDNSDSYVQLAIQGPKAEAVLQELTDLDLSLIQYYGFTFGNVNGTRGLISRTGYLLPWSKR